MLVRSSNPRTGSSDSPRLKQELFARSAARQDPSKGRFNQFFGRIFDPLKRTDSQQEQSTNWGVPVRVTLFIGACVFTVAAACNAWFPPPGVGQDGGVDGDLDTISDVGPDAEEAGSDGDLDGDMEGDVDNFDGDVPLEADVFDGDFEEDSGSDGDGDSDTDTDADGDTDVDGDGDADADTCEETSECQDEHSPSHVCHDDPEEEGLHCVDTSCEKDGFDTTRRTAPEEGDPEELDSYRDRCNEDGIPVRGSCDPRTNEVNRTEEPCEEEGEECSGNGECAVPACSDDEECQEEHGPSHVCDGTCTDTTCRTVAGTTTRTTSPGGVELDSRTNNCLDGNTVTRYGCDDTTNEVIEDDSEECDENGLCRENGEGLGYCVEIDCTVEGGIVTTSVGGSAGIDYEELDSVSSSCIEIGGSDIETASCPDFGYEIDIDVESCGEGWACASTGEGYDDCFDIECTADAGSASRTAGGFVLETEFIECVPDNPRDVDRPVCDEEGEIVRERVEDLCDYGEECSAGSCEPVACGTADPDAIEGCELTGRDLPFGGIVNESGVCYAGPNTSVVFNGIYVEHGCDGELLIDLSGHGPGDLMSLEVDVYCGSCDTGIPCYESWLVPLSFSGEWIRGDKFFDFGEGRAVRITLDRGIITAGGHLEGSFQISESGL